MIFIFQCIFDYCAAVFSNAPVLFRSCCMRGVLEMRLLNSTTFETTCIHTCRYCNYASVVLASLMLTFKEGRTGRGSSLIWVEIVILNK